MFLEIMQSESLSFEASKEIASAIDPTIIPHRFQVKKLLNLPLLQSVYAETLRMYVSVIMLRVSRRFCNIGTWSIPLGQQVAVCNYSQRCNFGIELAIKDPN